jgi:dephospho-CoA kinase
MVNKIVCLTGLCGSGKSVAGDYFTQKGYQYVRFGDLTMEILKEKRMEVNEVNERMVREELREKHGMAAFALLNLEKFEKLLLKGQVIADGLYSFEEYKVMKEHFGEKLVVITIYASPKLRYERLGKREIRPLTPSEAESRDFAELEKLNKGGTMAMADFMVINNQNVDYLFKQLDEIKAEIEK